MKNHYIYKKHRYEIITNNGFIWISEQQYFLLTNILDVICDIYAKDAKIAIFDAYMPSETCQIIYIDVKICVGTS